MGFGKIRKGQRTIMDTGRDERGEKKRND